MSLPGFNLKLDTEKTETVSVTLEPGNEWRFEIDFGSALKVKVLTGTAEIFGTELVPGREYTFDGQKSAIFTWHGCEFEYSSSSVTEYTSDETPMSVYANLHFALEALRPSPILGLPKDSVTTSTVAAPTVLVLGPKNSGKTSLCKILSSYACKQQRFPMLVNLNPSEGVFTVPGALSAAPVSDILDVEEGWGASQINGPAQLHPKQPYVHFYGLDSPLTNVKYYKYVISRLALAVSSRVDNDEVVRGSGTIIDTPSSLIEKDPGHSIISNIVADFDVNVICVVGHERLYSDMVKRFKEKKNVSVIKVVKSGGCVERDATYIRSLQSRSIRDYFYGSSKQSLSPYTVTVDFSHITVYRIAEESSLQNLSVLPVTDDEETSSAPKDSSSDYLIRLDPSTILQNCVMAVLNASRDDPISTLVESEVIGFVHV